ncbi:MAG: hypothetical protein IJ222_09990 [Bacteroidales bacterium]|nr:hypothetical protein [Bacteroidales bacterium]
MKTVKIMRAAYMAPVIELQEIASASLICTSGNAPDSGFEGLNDPVDLEW